MLIYFHKNKFRYNKGQLAPFFILALVALIIMSLVTINLSKVTFIKTDSSNAVDAGALAAGSVMANVFNAVAQANSQMEASYWEFYATVSVLFVISLALLVSAMAMACPSPCSAGAPIGKFIGATRAIGVTVTAFSLAQDYFYLSMRNIAKKGRESAIKIGHRLTFTNSGIGSKLKEGSPPESLVGGEDKNNYRDTFNQFLANLGDEQGYTYSWQDGEGRAHLASAKITIDEVGTFDLKITVLPSLAVSGLLLASAMLATAAEASLDTACIEQLTYFDCQLCCSPYSPGCCVCAAAAYAAWMAACAAAEVEMAGIFPLMAVAWAGLLPGPTFTSSGDFDSLLFIISWIEDIEHNRLVRVDTTQQHEGTDLGLWETTYPDTRSYSIVDFRGRGQIHPPNLRHDASIIETD